MITLKPHISQDGPAFYCEATGECIVRYPMRAKRALQAFARTYPEHIEGNTMTFNGIEITPATIQRTREHFAELCRGCIADAKSGKVHVNNLRSYIVWQQAMLKDALAGRSDHTFTFQQRAHWLQTGECVPFFAPAKP